MIFLINFILINWINAQELEKRILKNSEETKLDFDWPTVQEVEDLLDEYEEAQTFTIETRYEIRR